MDLYIAIFVLPMPQQDFSNVSVRPAGKEGEGRAVAWCVTLDSSAERPQRQVNFR